MAQVGANKASVLSVQGVEKRFGGVSAVRGVSFTLTEGEILGVIGPNGAGKSSLFAVVAGALKPDRGKVLLRGKRIDGLPEYQVVRRGVARTYQNCRLFGGLSVRDNIRVAIENGRRDAGSVGRSFLTAPGRVFSGNAGRRIEETLELLDIAQYGEMFGSELPFGVQRRVAIARAAATGGEVLLLDEPTAGMNEEETRQLGETIRTVRDDGRTLVVIEHDMSVVFGVCDRIIVLNFGSVIADGTPEAVQKDPEVREAYLGRGLAEAAERYRRLRRSDSGPVGFPDGQ